MSLSTYIGVAVVLPCVLAVFMCSVACSSGDQSPQSASCRTAGVPLISLTSRTLHQPHPSSASLVVRQVGRQARHCTLHYCELCCSHTRTSDYMTLCSCALFSNIVLVSRMMLSNSHRTLTTTPSSPYVRRRFFPFYLRNVGVSFKKPEADATVISHSF